VKSNECDMDMRTKTLSLVRSHALAYAIMLI